MRFNNNRYNFDPNDYFYIDDGWNLRYKKNVGHAKKDALAGWSSNGYKMVSVKDQGYFAHRIIWRMVKGYWSISELDHISGVPSDNRIENLRECTRSQNSMNSKMFSNNKSGVSGVGWHKLGNKWYAEIRVNKKRIHLGLFNKFEDAAKAREQAEIEYFGEFRRVA